MTIPISRKLGISLVLGFLSFSLLLSFCPMMSDMQQGMDDMRSNSAQISEVMNCEMCSSCLSCKVFSSEGKDLFDDALVVHSNLDVDNGQIAMLGIREYEHPGYFYDRDLFPRSYLLNKHTIQKKE